MNEQIKKLMVEAGIDVEKLRTYSGGWPREDLIILQDFAKLMVKECAGICESMQLIGPYKEVQDATLKDAAVQIREYFGVEE